ncbi:hypothetical protein L596_011444 [Steinernema carpocapsae]|uniref:Receptor expression-enhancing protein n=1 Tax=Steinernema carpocapsae TaxID=34508 RepID=A0A4U5NUD8_STECR|nr:hypothetical protein L596_011444 [Steinernema carpocapsae]
MGSLLAQLNDEYMRFLYNQENPQVRAALEKLEEISGMKREKAVMVFIAALVAVVTLFSLGRTLHLTLGIVHPLMNSLRAVRSLRRSKVNIGSKGTEDVCKWVVYWCIFGIFATVEVINGMGSDSAFLQFYWILKTILLVILHHPVTNGALHLFECAIDPIIARYDAIVSGKKTN